MIHDARVLEDDFLPQEVVHRHDEMNHLSAALEPAVEGERPEDVLIEGPSGAGKTCIARYAVTELEREVLDIETQYIDCWQHSNHFRILYKILEGVSTTYDIHRSTPRDEMIERLEAIDQPYIIILDEADQVEDPDLLRELYGIPAISMILIANRERDIVGTLDERLQSRLRSATTIHFDQYTDAELEAILADRIEWGLQPEAISETQVEHIASAAAGDARDAIGILRSAARNAEHAGSDTIHDTHIETAIPEARATIRQKSLEKLTDHQRVVYDILDDSGPLSPQELYAEYQSAVDDPRTKRTLTNYLGKLDQYNLIEAEGRGPSRTYRIVTQQRPAE
jgi:orc1/cdc6 family replication initiation protein